MHETILIPIGGGVNTDRSIEMGLEIAATCGASVHVLRLIDTNWRRTYRESSGSQLLTGRSRGSMRAQSPTSHADDRKADAWAATRRATREARASGVETVTRVVYGHSSDVVAAYATDYGIDLIVMSMRERSHLGWLRRTLPSRIVERVTANTAVPVLVVPAVAQHPD